jgi:alkane 1-monooxygenase
MNGHRLKYLAIFLLPLTVAFSFVTQGWWTFLPSIVFFSLIPLLELVLRADASNYSEIEKDELSKNPFYDVLLFLMVPLQICFLFWYFTIITDSPTYLEQAGRTIAMGMMCGIIGINVGHELGHRMKKFERFFGEVLLLTSLENHFLPYHNRGHHFQVATPQDPATARRNEWLFVFWFRSQTGSYFQAWKIENERMKIQKQPILSLKNKMVQYTLVHLALFLLIYSVYGGFVLLQFIKVAIIGILLLETVNYIEHYGLLRKKRENGTYERVKRIHSWNSNHVLGRSVLFELTRHSDHHYKADRPYQLLESHEESPTMPTGYPGMMLLAFFPPLFFKVMNNRIDQHTELKEMHL